MAKVIAFTAWFILISHNNIITPDVVNISALFLDDATPSLIINKLLTTLPELALARYYVRAINS